MAAHAPVADPSRLAQEGEHLRMTAVFAVKKAQLFCLAMILSLMPS
jgi:hypothetical protein